MTPALELTLAILAMAVIIAFPAIAGTITN